MTILVISDPEVDLDPDTPVQRWRLSDRGILRMRAFVASDAVSSVTEVWASTETKAIEAAGLLAARFGLPVNVDQEVGEHDRSATGFLQPTDFEAAANVFFAHPSESVRGWETALAAQERVTRSVQSIISNRETGGDLAIVAHGGVETLLLCAMLGLPISREKDQPFQGHFWAFDSKTKQVLHEWKPIAPR